MTQEGFKVFDDYIIPPSIVTRADVSRLITEAERVNEAMISANIHQETGSDIKDDASMSERLREFLDANELDFGSAGSRGHIITEMHKLKDSVPVVHMTFAADADAESLSLLVDWFRSNAHSQTVISVGLQPSLVAGVHLRTTNHVHDFSLRGMIEAGRPILVKDIEALHG